MAVDDALRRVGLSNAQYAVLAILEDEGALSGAELARRLFVTPQTMNQIVASLQARALVGRVAHPFHGRILETSLTDRGRSLLAAAHQRVRAIEARMVAGLSEQEQHELVRLLGACARALIPTGGADHARRQVTRGPDTRQEPGSPS